jgi:hypothetical protein
MQQYYRFDRTYKVPARSKYEARVKFSRALENREEDQYYVGTNVGATHDKTGAVVLSKLVAVVSWFFGEAFNQLFGYPKYKRY